MAESLWGNFPFGKHKGKDIEDIPESYLEWLLSQEWFIEKFNNKVPIVKDELKFRKQFGDDRYDEDGYLKKQGTVLEFPPKHKRKIT